MPSSDAVPVFGLRPRLGLPSLTLSLFSASDPAPVWAEYARICRLCPRQFFAWTKPYVIRAFPGLICPIFLHKRLKSVIILVEIAHA